MQNMSGISSSRFSFKEEENFSAQSDELQKKTESVSKKTFEEFRDTLLRNKDPYYSNFTEDQFRESYNWYCQSLANLAKYTDTYNDPGTLL